MNIVVTGASKGIGREIVKQLNKDKENTVFAVSRDKKRLESLKKECPFPEQVFIFEVDLTQDIAATDFYKTIQNAVCIDVLINNAGALINKPFLELSLDEWRSVFEVNLFSTVKLTQLVVPQLKKSKKAHIVNIGSMGGVENSIKFRGLSAYSASKAALANFSQCMAEELKEEGIYCNCLSLGAVDTEMLQQAFPDYKAQTTAAEMALFIADFVTKFGRLNNGKIFPIASSTP